MQQKPLLCGVPSVLPRHSLRLRLAWNEGSVERNVAFWSLRNAVQRQGPEQARCGCERGQDSRSAYAGIVVERNNVAGTKRGSARGRLSDGVLTCSCITSPAFSKNFLRDTCRFASRKWNKGRFDGFCRTVHRGLLTPPVPVTYSHSFAHQAVFSVRLPF